MKSDSVIENLDQSYELTQSNGFLIKVGQEINQNSKLPLINILNYNDKPNFMKISVVSEDENSKNSDVFKDIFLKSQLILSKIL